MKLILSGGQQYLVEDCSDFPDAEVICEDVAPPPCPHHKWQDGKWVKHQHDECKLQARKNKFRRMERHELIDYVESEDKKRDERIDALEARLAVLEKREGLQGETQP